MMMEMISHLIPVEPNSSAEVMAKEPSMSSPRAELFLLSPSEIFDLGGVSFSLSLLKMDMETPGYVFCPTSLE